MNPDYAYMNDEHYLPRWGLIQWYIERYCPPPISVLDLACGYPNIHTVMPWIHWRGVDKADPQMRNAEVYVGDIASSITVQNVCTKRTYSCIAWLGIEADPVMYGEIMSPYINALEKNGIVIIDYMVTNPAWFRLTPVMNLKFITGCHYVLPFVPGEKCKKWPEVNNRIVEVYRKCKPNTVLPRS